MPGPPLRVDQQRAALIAAVEAEDDLGIELSVADAEFLVGWENVVLATSDGWILRFPRGSQQEYVREVAVLRRLAGRLPVPIPTIAATGKRRDFAVYRRLTGASLDLAAYDRADRQTRDRLATSIARFLAAMHGALSGDEIAELGVPAFGADGQPVVLPDEIAAAYGDRLAALQEEQRSLAARAHATVLLHDDLHPGNFVLDAPVGRLSGVWDFSCVSVGDPSQDFRYLVGDSMDLAERIASAYAARTGREIDLGLASVSLQLEEISDALEEGRDPTPYLT
ncbi:phosphotransferase [Microlunatus soli]|uniref:Predicted kinase, aminoglycoside phosphotransferase (APT) family n=1 Tax=Microlunatus soli TaxID=630515 RepID=A0A1H1WQ46_9ACTN|nr:phosphotransferase [Microlunatus soli]SDS98486.1 Predicted kinase, aminoglycoside phosphotransferase (APT) family [Microlunatus soli]